MLKTDKAKVNARKELGEGIAKARMVIGEILYLISYSLNKGLISQ